MGVLIKNARIVNRGKVTEADVLIEQGRITKIASGIAAEQHQVTDLGGHFLLPGVIDDQVHFREPGLTYKADIASESRAAVAGGVTSFMEMPNVKPPTLSQQLLEEKYRQAARVSPANYSFYMGVSNDNLEEVLKTDASLVCGLKIFMGSSTGNMLVDDAKVLEAVFSKTRMLIATHCEDEMRVRARNEQYRHTPDAGAWLHPIIRDAEACYISSSFAVQLARRYNTRLHVLHISTEKELSLFDGNEVPLEKKHITAEVCVHHLSFNDTDYATLGNRIKCNPAIKSPIDQEALWKGIEDGKLDIIATDHAPHTWEEKQGSYWDAPSGLPLVQHSLPLMLDHYTEGRISLERIADMMSHRVAIAFNIKDRGFVEEGMWADLVAVDPSKPTVISKAQLLYKCAWSPLEGRILNGSVLSTWVNGRQVWDGKQVLEGSTGMRMEFQPR